MGIKRIISLMGIGAVAIMGMSGGTRERMPAGYELVWSEEFDHGDQLDGERWTWENWEPGRVNNELQNYRSGLELIDGQRTTRIEDGMLKLRLFRGKDGEYYSARINSRSGDPEESQGWKYGYVEARIKLPQGRGTWPAFWMLPADVQWGKERSPGCGEIDLMEEQGTYPGSISVSLHSEGHNPAKHNQITKITKIADAEEAFHTYAMLWTHEAITFYIDGEEILTYENDGQGSYNWPYDRPYHVILNIAWGGTWGATKGIDPDALPTEMLVDYIRVYQLKEDSGRQE